ncbi:hypothetical protein CPB86DRAFT_785718 [Serendipita vermifera]|nr:hypothetical protein CPB86DRAFT_785718 [Serendipita vermifera]
MAQPLPSSLSPHVVTLLSPDLVDLLRKSSLPPLHHILQSYSPLPLVTTRTTTLTPVQHKAFHLRFSGLEQVEAACREDEETRSSRFIDWLGTRIARRAPKWVEEASQRANDASNIRTPWWEEMRRCVEGDWMPSRSEGWNHPVAIICAVSTLAPNPLQAATTLYSRPIDFPPWMDSTILRYILIIHPKNSPLNPDECLALYNAIKKQYGLHVHLLHLTFDPGPAPIPIIPLPPQLPLPNVTQDLSGVPDTSELWMSEMDAQATGKFVREFLTQSLIPWMEKHVLDWNEAFSNNKRLPTRIFTSTRRLFGTTNTMPATPSTSSSFNTVSPTSASAGASLPPPQRRLAEFATFLGDFKVAVAVWESLRKEGKGGAAVLPLLLVPSPSFVSYAAQALAPVFAVEPSATSLMNALICSVRWEIGIRDLFDLGVEKWLVWAASTAEEAPTAVLLGHAALLSRLKGSKRRAALWYVMAAHRLEKCGVKALTAHFLREAHGIYSSSPVKNLSPSFADSEKWPSDPNVHRNDWPIVLTNIEHSLGRILYSSGDAEDAVRLFLSLLQYSVQSEMSETDAVAVDDFKLALEHLESTHSAGDLPPNLTLPVKFCLPKECKIRLHGQRDEAHGLSDPTWESLSSIWSSSREKGKGQLEDMHAEVNQRFWFDLVLANPLEATVQLKSVTLKFSRPGEDDLTSDTLAQCEVVGEVQLLPKQRQKISIAVNPLISGKLCIADAKYLFISSLPVTEALSIRGKRLNDTASQRQDIVYAPSRQITLLVKEGGCRLEAEVVDEDEDDEDEPIELIQGELHHMTVRLKNIGTSDINQLWLTVDDAVTAWVDYESLNPGHLFALPIDQEQEELQSVNQMQDTAPVLLSLEKLSDTSNLPSGQSIDVPLILHADGTNHSRLNILITYCGDGGPFFFTKFTRALQMNPCLSINSTIQPSPSNAHAYSFKLEVENVSDELEVDISHISALSVEWAVHAGAYPSRNSRLPPYQTYKTSLGLDHRPDTNSQELRGEVTEKISEFLFGRPPPSSKYEDLPVRCSHISKGNYSVLSPHLQHFLLTSRRRHYLKQLLTTFPTVPKSILQLLFPLYTPHSIDVTLFWHLPHSDRQGIVISCDLQVGAGHGMLQEVLERAGHSKAKSIYAETKREHELLLQHFTECEWNRETDPVVVHAKAENILVDHDFAKGPLSMPVEFQVHNYSPTNPIRYLFKLPGTQPISHVKYAFSPTYSGQLTHRGVVQPYEHSSIKALLRVSSPGQYMLSGWRLEIDLGEAGAGLSTKPDSRSDGDENGDDEDAPNSWTIRRRYLQQSSGDEVVILVKNVAV